MVLAEVPSAAMGAVAAVGKVMPSLHPNQYSLVFNAFSFSVATMFAAFVFFVIAQSRIAPKYRISMMVSALVVGIAGYHYFRIMGSWEGAYVAQGTMYVFSGKPFNDAYRYVDWLLTVPLLLVELVLVMSLPKSKSGSMLTKLSLAAALMIATGYPGEVAAAGDIATRAMWGAISTVPFVYILYVLFKELGDTIAAHPPEAQVLFRNMRLLLLATWGFYPIAYMAPFVGFTGAGAEVAVQVGYTICDVLAKAGYGVLIYNIARIKSENEGWSLDGTAKASHT